jgi:GTP cyclohydrolase III
MTEPIDWELAELGCALFILEGDGRLGMMTKKSARDILDRIQHLHRDIQVSVLQTMIETVIGAKLH